MEGKDQVYDNIRAEISKLEEGLDEKLEDFKESLGYELLFCPFGSGQTKLLSQIFSQLLAQRNWEQGTPVCSSR